MSFRSRADGLGLSLTAACTFIPLHKARGTLAAVGQVARAAVLLACGAGALYECSTGSSAVADSTLESHHNGPFFWVLSSSSEYSIKLMFLLVESAF